jgi:hypothetical protein
MSGAVSERSQYFDATVLARDIMVSRWLPVFIDLSHWVTPGRSTLGFGADLFPGLSVDETTVSRCELRGRFKFNYYRSSVAVGTCGISGFESPEWRTDTCGQRG